MFPYFGMVMILDIHYDEGILQLGPKTTSHELDIV